MAGRQIAAGEIIAFRAWKVQRIPAPYLFSYSREYIWKRGENRAYDVPTEQNSTGFYALKNYNAVLDYWGVSPDWFCLGSVELWGEVIEGTLGYRAEFAAVKNIISLVRAAQRPTQMSDRQEQERSGLPIVVRILVREYDNDGPLITELRERYLE